MINENLIRKKLNEMRRIGITETAIYPYGVVGKELANILSIEGFKIYIFDREYKNAVNIINPERCKEFKNIFFWIATYNLQYRKEITEFLLEKGVSSDRLISVFPRHVCFDDRKNKNIDYELIGNCRKFRSHLKFIVSLTTFPARIGYVVDTIISIINQTFRPDKIILWLGKEEFPHKEDDIPKSLLKLQNELFQIRWYNDIKSYKKLIPALSEFPNDIIVTADDDIIYSPKWLEDLINTHNQYPREIICHRITKLIKDKIGHWANIPGGLEYYDGGSYLNKLTGCGGVLYPVGALYPDVTKEVLFMRLAPTSDDIWFWLMGVLNGVPVRKVDANQPDLNINPKTIYTPSLSKINDHNSKLFWVHFYNIISLYPEIQARLEAEFHRVRIRNEGIID